MTDTKFTKAQQSAIDAAVAEQLAKHVEDAAEPVTGSSMREALGALLEDIDLPSGKRVIISLVAGVVLAGATAFLGAQLVTVMMGYAAALTGSAFLLFMIQFLGYALTVIGAAMLGGKLQALILGGGVDRGFHSAKGFIAGVFKKSATETVAS